MNATRRHFLQGSLAATTGLALDAATTHAAAPPKLRFGTLVPKGSSYYLELQKMGEAWRTASAGKHSLTIYADGSMGGEIEMVRRIRLGQLQGGLLTVLGLTSIEPDVGGLQNLPLMFRDLEDVDYVGDKLQPALEKKLEAKGFVVLFWGDAGWVRYFSNKPVRTPDDMKRLKVWSWAGDVEQFELMRRLGMNPVSLEVADILPGLKTGLIDAVAMPPFAALAAQVDLAAPHMLELNYAPLVGAAVITKKVWDELPPALQTAMLASAKIAGAEIKREGRKEALESVAAMQKRGLKVVKPTSAEIAEWEKLMQSAYPTIRGKLVPVDIFDEAKRLLDERHAAQGVRTP